MSEAHSAEERAACWSIREAVFIREQGIDEEIERDGLDDVAWHLVARDDEGRAVGTARILALDSDHVPVARGRGTIVKIGRMAVAPANRGLGVGRMLLDAALALAREHGYESAELSAQEQVIPFYEKASFRSAGDPYLEAGIAHRRMSRRL
ncbi:MAG: GNAT family N-acetyltransferase [Candidatus Binatia bacterium]